MSLALHFDPLAIAGYAWMLFALIWLIGALTTKRSVRRESVVSRLRYSVPSFIGALLIFKHGPLLGPLDARVIPNSPAVLYLGVALTLLGLAFAVAARFYLGRNWSGAITVKEDHQLMRSGPYALVRHPIYTGVLAALLGSALIHGRWRSLLGFAILVIALRAKSLIEERFMATQFGDDYARYRTEVKALVPFVW